MAWGGSGRGPMAASAQPAALSAEQAKGELGGVRRRRRRPCVPGGLVAVCPCSRSGAGGGDQGLRGPRERAADGGGSG